MALEINGTEDIRVFCTQAAHRAANKIIPILMYSELALSHCTDPQIQKYLEYIRGSAEELRTLVVECKQRLRDEQS
ncbi:MAG: hypothetical protein D6690_07095 [Nitrospirae bacterium]|nr:MAG: hypothetical protein D6690_07095 [Nitrospirota bacterium]